MCVLACVSPGYLLTVGRTRGELKKRGYRVETCPFSSRGGEECGTNRKNCRIGKKKKSGIECISSGRSQTRCAARSPDGRLVRGMSPRASFSHEAPADCGVTAHSKEARVLGGHAPADTSAPSQTAQLSPAQCHSKEVSGEFQGLSWGR